MNGSAAGSTTAGAKPPPIIICIICIIAIIGLPCGIIPGGIMPCGIIPGMTPAWGIMAGMPCGIMDQLCIAAGREGHATQIDCRSLEVRHVPVPDSVKVVVRFVASRTLEGSEYATRVRECAAAEAEVGPLRDAALRDLSAIGDETVRRRAIHVVSENARVESFAMALSSYDYGLAGEIMLEGHRSLAENFATSTPVMDRAVAELADTPGVYGARMTGGGFGGCVVALCDPEARVDGWVVRASEGARLERA